MKMTASAQAMRHLRDKRKASGLCTRCGKASETVLCSGCKQQLRSYKKPRIKAAFRKPRKWTATNYSLYRYMVENNISAKKLGEMVGVSERAVLRWVFEKATPKEPVKSKVESLVGDSIF
ncbi:MAG: hypothetical protein N2376_05340 [Clostridia bacterium]|nr:hypothetical protein [Clostridia bacterium]